MPRRMGVLALLVLPALLWTSSASQAEGVDAGVQAKLDAKFKTIQTWAADPAIVKAVKAVNEKLPDGYKEMTEDKWKDLSKLDPFVRALTKNDAAEALRKLKDDSTPKAFVNAANGMKVAFLGKTINWSHQGKPKHEDPMKGKTWQGPIEVDESTGVQAVQLAVPVMDGDKPIGSLVVSVELAKLK